MLSLDTGAPIVAQPGILITAQPGTATEGGSSVTVSFQLRTQPTAGVQVHLTSGDSDAVARAATFTRTFSTTNWDTPQSLEMSAVDDDDLLDESVTMTLTTASTGQGGDADYNAGLTATFTVTVTDAGEADPVNSGSEMWWWDSDTLNGGGGTFAPADGSGNLGGTFTLSSDTDTLWLTMSASASATRFVNLVSFDTSVVTLDNIGAPGDDDPDDLNSYGGSGTGWRNRGGGHRFTIEKASGASDGDVGHLVATVTSTDPAWDDSVSVLTVTLA